MEYPILSQIHSPADLKALDPAELAPLCAEIRSFLIETVSKTGGHLSSNLGVVELTVMLHRIFDSPQDAILFDVGHQAYTHKLLTGRFDRFDTLRQKGGLAGFPRAKESAHDPFIAGHSSTSISAAYGIACAMQLCGDDHTAIAVIGDGALTGGEAYEALNNAGRSGSRIVVIINHNDMSISKNVGAFARYLSSIRSRPGYLRFKRTVDRVLSHTPLIGAPLRSWLERSKSFVKTLIYRSTFFEEMGFVYLGPINGHNLSDLSRVLTRAKEIAAPVVIQIETVKGKGYAPAEENPGAYHATGPFDAKTGESSTSGGENYSTEAGRVLNELADADARICAITAAMKHATGLHPFAAAHRDRFFDVGIAEEHALTFAGGLASRGMIPVFCVYSSFLQRGYDQIIHDLAIERQHAVLCVDRAGVVGEDGETHQGVFDAAFLSAIPGVTVYSPEGYAELALCIRRAVTEDDGVVAVRYPRGKSTVVHSLAPDAAFTYHSRGGKLLLISYGREFSNVYAAAEGEEAVSLLKLTRISPIPEEAIAIAMEYPAILFAEEGIRTGGIAEQFAAKLLERGYRGRYRIAAIADRFVEQGSVDAVLESLGLGKHALQNAIREELARE